MGALDLAVELIFWLSAGLLFYVYRGYLQLLQLLVRLRRPAPPPRAAPASSPDLTVLLTVHNEASLIGARLADLLDQDYPRSRLEILVASDGSTDATEAIVEAYPATSIVRLFRTGGRLGKSATQNAAVAAARGAIIVLTDAEARFDRYFLREIAAPFADPAVGCVTGRLELLARPGAIARGQGYYWRYETRLRELESRLGILAVASGQAMAVRRRLFEPLPPHVGDDCMIPLDVALAGYRVVHCESALAYDAMAHEPEAELGARIRMTLRNWTGTWLRPRLLNPLRHPGYAWALWSHKLLRWLGPLFLIALTLSALWLARRPLYVPLAIAVLAFYGLAAIGWRNSRGGRRWAPGDAAYSFLLANLGFFLGLAKALGGRRVVAYRADAPPG
jgi:cellulose synthase/poly-beta-1,6-N-acetylglucosamine synthase-like glycosyltransferase